MTLRRLIRLAAAGLALAPTLVGAHQSPDEEQARRQLESGRAFARQGNYAEALRDFRVVAETYASSSVADDALLEIARYHLDVRVDAAQAAAAVEAILKRYPTSDSAPDAYVITGRLAMLKGHQPADLDAALASFDRVFRLFPAASAVPESLVLAGEAHWLAGRSDEALASLMRAAVEYPTDRATARGHLAAARVLVSRGDPIGAMEELQQVRNRWPASAEAETALGRLTLLHRLYVRARGGGAAFALTAETPGPARLQNVVALGASARGAVYWAAQSGLGLLAPEKAPAPPPAVRPRGLTVDRSGNPAVIDAGGILPFGGERLALVRPRRDGAPEPLDKIDGAVQVYGGDWIVADEDVRGALRFTRTGEPAGQFAAVRVAGMAVNALDHIAAVDRDQKGIVFFDAAGTVIGRIPPKGQGYELANVEALAFDTFGHLYVLDREAVAVFTPHGPAGKTYGLLTLHADAAAFRRATAFALDASGGLFLYDDRVQRVQVFR